jgi:hypothetical protein
MAPHRDVAAADAERVRALVEELEQRKWAWVDSILDNLDEDERRLIEERLQLAAEAVRVRDVKRAEEIVWGTLDEIALERDHRALLAMEIDLVDANEVEARIKAGADDVTRKDLIIQAAMVEQTRPEVGDSDPAWDRWYSRPLTESLFLRGRANDVQAPRRGQHRGSRTRRVRRSTRTVGSRGDPSPSDPDDDDLALEGVV